MRTAISFLAFSSILQVISCSSPAFHRFSFGNANGTIVTDGPTLFADNPFLVPDETVAASYAQSGRTINPITLQQNVVIVDLPNVGRIMVDTGSRGDQPSPDSPDRGVLFVNLEAAGITPESIDFVLLTHGHPDHANGLRLPGGGSAFPNAQVYIGKVEHEFWSNPPLEDGATDTSSAAIQFFSFQYLQDIESYQGRITLVRRNRRILPGVRFIYGPGHSPGHSAIEIISKRKRLVVAGDTWVTREDQLQNPEWGFEFSTSRRAALFSRLKLLSTVAWRRDLVVAYHEKFPGLGLVKRTGLLSFEWVPSA